jgi:hypothetical protein
MYPISEKELKFPSNVFDKKFKKPKKPFEKPKDDWLDKMDFITSNYPTNDIFISEIPEKPETPETPDNTYITRSGRLSKKRKRGDDKGIPNINLNIEIKY